MNTTDDTSTPVLNHNLAELASRLGRLDGLALFFVGGVVKSGTTWLERLLDAHPQIACKGEAHFGSVLEPRIRDAVARYNAVIGKKGNWSKHRADGVDDTPVVSYSYLTDDLDLILAQAIRLMLVKWVDDPRIRSIGEKTPDNAEHLKLLRRLFPESRFIYIVRDIRDVIVSGWFFNLSVSEGKFRARYADLDAYAAHMTTVWTRNVSAALSQIKSDSHRSHWLRYEDLWREPTREAARVFTFLDVEHGESMVAACVAATDFSRLSGGRRHGAENRSSFYRKGVIGDFENHLSTMALERIERECGAVMRVLGYQ